MKTIYILWLRQLKRYGRSKSRIVGALGQPILFLFALGYGLNPVFEKAGQGSYIQFLIPGIICMSVLFTSVFTGIELIWDRQFGFLKETLVAPVSRTEIMLGRTLGGATVATGQGIVVSFISLLAGFHPASWPQVPLAFLVMLLVATLFTALGTAIASLLEDMQGFQLIMNFLVMPLFFLSGALFPLQTGKNVLSTVACFDPLSYGVDAIRTILTHSTHYGLATDLGVLTVITALLVAVGSYLFSKIQL